VNPAPAREFRTTPQRVADIGHSQKIGAGENGGREITYDYTVRKLVKAAELLPFQGSSVQKETRIAVGPSRSLDHVGVTPHSFRTPVSLKIGGTTSKYPIRWELNPTAPASATGRRPYRCELRVI